MNGDTYISGSMSKAARPVGVLKTGSNFCPSSSALSKAPASLKVHMRTGVLQDNELQFQRT